MKNFEKLMQRNVEIGSKTVHFVDLCFEKNEMARIYIPEFLTPIR